MPRPIVIIHGWSDSSASFRRLAGILAHELDRDVATIDLADYNSMDDEVTFADIRAGMDRAWTDVGLPRTPRSVDVVVHSTGGLVIRDWMTTHFKPDTNPVHNLVMLAPANFGSPLAHKGHAFMGRVVKGWNSRKRFQTGKRVLKGLELASPFSWELAMRDRFGSQTWYDAGHCHATVIVGNTGYSGIAAAANEPGTDGTVRVSTAALDGLFIEADFQSDPQTPSFKTIASKGRTGLAVMAGENHGTVTFKGKDPRNDEVLKTLLAGLEVDDAGYDGWCDELDAFTEAVMLVEAPQDNDQHGFQNTVFHVVDDQGAHVPDYFIEFYVEDGDRGIFERWFHEDVIETVHAYGDDKSYRSMLIDCTVLHTQVDKQHEGMRMSLSAVPDFSENKVVGYESFGNKDIGGLRLDQGRLKKVFRQNRTVLIRVTLKRMQDPSVFRIRPAS